MSKNSVKNILWSVRDVSLPKSIWDRLEDQGYRVIIVEGNEEGMEKMEKVAPCLWIGESKGDRKALHSLLERLGERHPQLPVIVMSRQPDVQDAVQAIKCGVADYIAGDVSPERLWASLEGALAGPFPGRVKASPYRASSKENSVPIAVHPRIRKMVELANRIAPSRSNVLIQGESGTGKEVFARFIHSQSDRKMGPFIAVNCAALPENLLESELFGHEKGAFTGAVAKKKGKFELANNGTLLLDEISEMALSLQGKLLRVLQEREIDRVGGQGSIPVDARVIATTNRDLETEVKEGRFRLDLFYRLNVVPILLPPLRERPDDIVPLAQAFLEKHSTLNHMEKNKELSQEAEACLQEKQWPGNVRELENLMERAVLLVDEDVIGKEDVNALSFSKVFEDCHASMGPQTDVIPLREMEKKMIIQALHDHEGNRTRASKALGISVRTLRNKLHEYAKDQRLDNRSLR
jgi:two-component system response regulator FlrC